MVARLSPVSRAISLMVAAMAFPPIQNRNVSHFNARITQSFPNVKQFLGARQHFANIRARGALSGKTAVSAQRKLLIFERIDEESAKKRPLPIETPLLTNRAAHGTVKKTKRFV